MSKALSVKVPTAKVITALEAKLTKIKKDYAEQETHEAKYQEAMEKWRKAVQKYALANTNKSENIKVNYRSWNNSLNVDFDIIVNEGDVPKEPSREYETIAHHYYKEMVEDITNALNILNMTEEDVVNATTMKSIARYL
jgi:hypothetical protein